MNTVDIFTTILILSIVSSVIYICIKFDICEMISVSGRYQNNNIQHILPQHIRNLNNTDLNTDLNNSNFNENITNVPPKYEDVVHDENNNVDTTQIQERSIGRPLSSPPGYGSIL